MILLSFLDIDAPTEPFFASRRLIYCEAEIQFNKSPTIPLEKRQCAPHFYEERGVAVDASSLSF
jgi:hypothetical protein